MRRFLYITIAALLLATTAQAAAPPPQWLPQESWPGGKQYDPRLERTVKFWGTGVPTAGLFASITEQTGVALGFSPPDDDNARICLNVYLNPKEPPTLRDMLVQIGWVMDCAWAVEGEGERRRYVLLHTSIGDNMLATLTARRRAEMAREMASRQRREGDLRAKLPARFAELREAMGLSRERLIARYRGRDDLLLLALLDPRRRAICRYLLTLPQAELLEPSGRPEQEPWSALTPEQRGILREVLEPQLRAYGAQNSNPNEHWDNWEWIESLRPTVEVTNFPTAYYIIVWLHGGTDATSFGPDVGMVILLDDPQSSPTVSRTECRTDLRRLLGEEVAPDEAERLYHEEEQLWMEAWERTELEESRAATLRLSPEAAAKLSAFSLPMRPEAPYALWQLQEALAVVSGRHVLSDAFWQPNRPFQKALHALFPGAGADPTALQVLTAACMRTAHDANLPDERDPGIVGWEWGDAGGFLRFRSAQRDVWRASLLSQTMLQTLDALVEPSLRDASGEGAAPGPVTISLDPRAYSHLLIPLDVFQTRFGGHLLYGDPTDPVNAYRHAFREEVLDRVGEARTMLRLLASVTDEQWEGLCGKGLVWGRDLLLRAHREDIPFVLWGIDDGWLLRLVPGEQISTTEQGPEDGPMAEPGVEALYLVVSPQLPPPHEGGQGGFHEFIPTRLTLQPPLLPHLVPPPSEYAP